MAPPSVRRLPRVFRDRLVRMVPANELEQLTRSRIVRLREVVDEGRLLVWRLAKQDRLDDVRRGAVGETEEHAHGGLYDHLARHLGFGNNTGRRKEHPGVRPYRRLSCREYRFVGVSAE